MMITETASPSGNGVMIEGNGRVLAQVNELVTIKIGETKGFLSAIITVATTVASAFVPGAIGVTGAAATATRAGIGLAGGLAQMAANKLMETPYYQEFSETMTINEFRKKYMISGERPISLELEYNQELANQYRNKRELKGPMLYTYKNVECFGSLLVTQPSEPKGHFLKASVISWNMARNPN